MIQRHFVNMKSSQRNSIFLTRKRGPLDLKSSTNSSITKPAGKAFRACSPIHGLRDFFCSTGITSLEAVKRPDVGLVNSAINAPVQMLWTFWCTWSWSAQGCRACVQGVGVTVLQQLVQRVVGLEYLVLLHLVPKMSIYQVLSDFYCSFLVCKVLIWFDLCQVKLLTHSFLSQMQKHVVFDSVNYDSVEMKSH